MSIIGDAVKGIPNLSLVMVGQREPVEVIAGVAAELLNQPGAGTNKKEVTHSDPDAVHDREGEYRNADRQDATGYIVSAESRPEAAQPGRSRTLAKNVVHQPLDGPGLQEVHRGGDHENAHPGEGLASGRSPIG